MAINTIEKMKSYLGNILDLVYQRGSISQVLDQQMVRDIQNVATQVLIPKLEFSNGLSDYNRDTGAQQNGVVMKWEVFNIEKDRGTTLQLDVVDNIDAASIGLARMASEFVRTKVNPEFDAYRFHTYANKAADSQCVSETLGADQVEDAIAEAQKVLEDAEVDSANLILFMSPTIYKLLTQEVKSRRLVEGTTVTNGVTTYDGIPVYRVPQRRFFTGCTLTPGGGFEVSGEGIEFMLMDKTVAVQVVRHTASRLFSPDENQDADAWKWRVRYFHDASVMENKRAGIYVVSDPAVTKSA